MLPFRGFRGSPVTKGLLTATSATSLYLLSSFNKRAKAPVLLSLLAFPHPGALLLGSGLLVRARAASSLTLTEPKFDSLLDLYPNWFTMTARSTQAQQLWRGRQGHRSMPGLWA